MNEPLPPMPGDRPSLLDAMAAPDDAAAWARGAVPGAAVVAPLAVLDPARLSQAARVDALAALERQLSWLAARQYRLLAAMAAESVPAGAQGEVDKDWLREDVACALRLSAGTAADRLALARALTRLPETLALLEAGDVTVHHARALAEAVNPLDDATALRVEARVLPKAPLQTLAAFKAAVRRAVLIEDGRNAQQRHERARQDRRVVFTPVADGMAEVFALLPADGAALLATSIDSIAKRRLPGDCRTADQRRADALVHLARGHHGGPSQQGELASPHGSRPAVQVTVALSTLLGVDEQPAELDGYGPIPAALARRIAADPVGVWRRLVTDEHGRLLDYGRTTYRPPADLTDFVTARDRSCTFPGCHRSARRCDLDHLIAWNEGGTTSATNIHALCPRHHHLKHEAGWRVRRRPDGSTEWASPTGHTYQRPAASLPIDRTITADDQTAADPDPPPF